MDVDVISVPGGSRLSDEDLGAFVSQLHKADLERIFAIVGTSGTTNLGIIDDLDAIADVCGTHGWWMHVDGAYGGAALAAASPPGRPLKESNEPIASSLTLTNGYLRHLIAAHFYTGTLSMHELHTGICGEYLEVLYDGEWNPSDYAQVSLFRRARGLPFGSVSQHTVRKPIAMPLRKTIRAPPAPRHV